MRSLLPFGLLLLVGCGSGPTTQVKVEIAPPRDREAVTVPTVKFQDVTDSSGLRFHHTNGGFGKKLLPETMGAGVVVFDYNKDGKPDLFFVNSCFWPGHEPSGVRAPTSALYRNESTLDTIKFTEVSEAVGLAITLYGQGATAGDYDNDGWTDLFVTGVGGNRLFRNEGGRRFVDVTAIAGVGGPGGWPANGDFLRHDRPISWSTSATFVDHDRDGKLDLFVCNYITWSPAFDLSLESSLKGARDRAYGPPIAFPGSQCLLYRNLGNGRFEDVSRKAGVHVEEQQGTGGAARMQAVGKSLGVIAWDADDDGWPDLAVANDTVRNFFFHNKRDGTFEEVGISANFAYAEGRARGAMGIDVAAYKKGTWAVLIGNFADEPDTFLRLFKTNPLFFSDAALSEGLWGPSRTLLKFGVFFFDYDLDSRLDLMTCNGHLEPEIGSVQPGQRYAQPVQLFWNTGGAKQCYEPAPPQAVGEDLFKPLVGRGCAFLDLDGDGDLDIVLTANGGPARILRNDLNGANHWLRLTLEGDGKTANQSAIGARVIVEAGGETHLRDVIGGRGYLSQSEAVLTFGLGKKATVDKVTIRWPDREGTKQVLTGVKADQHLTIVQGK